jgi:quercetin dioxygenase-like cupin family protein
MAVCQCDDWGRDLLTVDGPRAKNLFMSHPDPNRPPDRTPIHIGEVWENPVTRERATILELPHRNPEGRAMAELTALVDAQVVGEHYHPALVERFTMLEGELTVRCDGQTSVLRQRECAVIEAGVCHDWWNASDRDARMRVEITPGERFSHMIETLFGLARLGYTNNMGMPKLQSVVAGYGWCKALQCSQLYQVARNYSLGTSTAVVIPTPAISHFQAYVAPLYSVSVISLTVVCFSSGIHTNLHNQ